EVRVKYPHLDGLAASDTIRFCTKGTDEACEVKVKRVTEYPNFEALLDGEGTANVTSTDTREQQLANVCVIRDGSGTASPSGPCRCHRPRTA
ncbi:hypothetical protein ACFCXB_39110, partial [Streptomyces noursei]